MENQTNVFLVISYSTEGSPWVSRQQISVGTDLKLQNIHHYVNEFFKKHKTLNSKVVITNNGRSLSTLLFEGLETELSERGEEQIRLVLHPIKSFNQLAQEIDSVQEEMKRLETAGLYAKDSSAPNQQTVSVGILYADPLASSGSLEQGNLKCDVPLEVTYEHQIHKIIRSASKISKEATIRSMPANRRNLRYMLRTLRVNILHISCHGTKEDSTLSFESERFGFEQKITVDRFREELRSSKHHLNCLVVMACHSWKFADAARAYCDFVVGIDEDQKVQNQAAETFSEVFYECLLNGFPYNKCAANGIQAVDQKFRHCDCCPDTIARNFFYPCKGLHKLIQCNCGKQRQASNRHLKGCIKQKQLNRYIYVSENPSKHSDKEIWYCCCAKGHPRIVTESSKFKVQTGQNAVTLSVEVASDFTPTQLPSEHESANIFVSDGRPLLTPSQQLYEVAQRYLIPVSKNQAEAFLVYGGSRVGKSYFVKRLVGYVTQRAEDASKTPLFKDWVYLDLASYRTLAQFLAESTIVRDGVAYCSLPSILSFIRQHRCIVVLDHCTEIALEYWTQFERFVKEDIRKTLSVGSKIILVADSCQNISMLKAAFTHYEFSLTEKQRFSIFTETARTTKCNSDKKDFDFLKDKLVSCLPTDLVALRALIPPNSHLHNPRSFQDYLKKYEQSANKVKSKNLSALSDSQKKGLAIYLVFDGLFNEGLIQQHSSKLCLTPEQAQNLIEIVRLLSKSPAGLTKLEGFLADEQISNQIFEKAMEFVLAIFTSCFLPVIKQITDQANEVPFFVPPLLNKNPRGCVSHNEELRVFDKTKNLPLVNSLLQINLTYSVRQRISKSVNAKEVEQYCWLITWAPLIKQYATFSQVRTLKSQFVHEAMRAIEPLHLCSEHFVKYSMDLCFLLIFARAEERERIKEEWEITRTVMFNKARLSQDKEFSCFANIYNYMSPCLDLQVEYFCEVKGLGSTDWKAFADAVHFAGLGLEQLINQELPQRQEIVTRHILDVSQATLLLIQRRKRCDQRMLEGVIQLLAQYQQPNSSCCLKYYQHKYLFEKEIRKTRECEVYRSMLRSLEKDMAVELGRQKVEALRAEISEEISSLQKSVVKIMTAQPISNSGFGLRTIDLWLTTCILQIHQTASIACQWDALTSTSLSATLQSHCRLLFLRVDIDPDAFLMFEEEGRVTTARRHLTELKEDFSKVDVLIVCGTNATRFCKFANPKNLVMVDLLQKDTEGIYKDYQRYRIHDEYSTQFVVEFVKGMFAPVTAEENQVTSACAIAKHEATMHTLKFMSSGININSFVKVSMDLHDSVEYSLPNALQPITQLSKQDIRKCSPYAVFGYQTILAELIPRLVSEKGVVICLDGNSQDTLELCKEVNFRLKKLKQQRVTFSTERIALNMTDFRIYILCSRDLEMSGEEIIESAKKGNNVLLAQKLLKIPKDGICTIQLKPQSQKQSFSLRMCRMLEVQFVRPFANMAPKEFEECIIDSSQTEPDEFDEKVFIDLASRTLKQTQAKNLFARNGLASNII